MSQQIIVTLRVDPEDLSDEGFENVKQFFTNLEVPVGEITDVNCEVEDGAPRGESLEILITDEHKQMIKKIKDDH